MSIIASRGAASSGGFGQFASSRGGAFKYYAQSAINNRLYGTNNQNFESFSSWTLLTPQPTSVSVEANTNNPPGIVASSKSVSTAWQYSNNGAAYTNIPKIGSGYTQNAAVGLNGNIAYNPTNKLLVSCFFSPGKFGSQTYVSFQNIETGASSQTTLGGQLVNVVYSPALNCFAVFRNQGQVRFFDGTTGAFLSDLPIGITAISALSISDDGYVLFFAESSTNIYSLYKVTNTGGSYTALGFSTQNPPKTPMVWNASQQAYFFVINQSVYRYTPSLGTYQILGAVSIPYGSFFKAQLMFTENNTMYVCAWGRDPTYGNSSARLNWSTDFGNNFTINYFQDTTYFGALYYNQP